MGDDPASVRMISFCVTRISTLPAPNELPFNAKIGTEKKLNGWLRSKPVKFTVAGKLNAAVPGMVNVSQAPVDRPKLPQPTGAVSAWATAANSNAAARIQVFIGCNAFKIW